MSDWIFKILRTDEWAAHHDSVSFKGAPIDLSDGYIHFSTLDQLQETADKHFAGEAIIHICAFSAALWPLSLKWETSRGGQLFPHLYEPLDMTKAAKHWICEKSSDGFFDITTIQEWAKNHD